MTGNEMKALGEFEGSLVPGMKVEVRWTNSHRFYRGLAGVVRVNKASVRVRLVEPVAVGSGGGYLPGHELVMPLGYTFNSGAFKWSPNNCVAPVGGFATAD